MEINRQQKLKELYDRQEELLSRKRDITAQIHDIEMDLAKKVWVANAPIEQLGEQIQKLNALQSSVDTWGIKRMKGEEALEEHRAEHPEAERGVRASDRIEEIDKQIRRLAFMEKDTDETEKELRIVREEKQRHVGRERLERELDSYPSEEELKNRIQEREKAVSDTEEYLASVNDQKAANQKVLDEFEAKSGLAKLFSGKKEAEAAREDILRCDERISRLQEELEEGKEQLNQARNEFGDWQALLGRIRAVVTPHTQEYCDHRIEALEKSLLIKKRDLPSVKQKEEELAKERALLVSKLKDMSEPYEKMVRLQSDLKEVDEETARTQQEAVSLSAALRDALVKELNVVEEFDGVDSSIVTRDSDTTQALYYRLSQIHQALAEDAGKLDELSAVRDAENLKAEAGRLTEGLAEIDEQMKTLMQKQ